MSEIFRTRFAPSPTGRLHLGHAYSALFAAKQAELKNGKFILRIEDIDKSRCRPEFEEGIYEDLAWLGLQWQEPVMRQSERSRAYQKAADQLLQEGFLYPCFCTRKEVLAAIEASSSAPHHSSGEILDPYPSTCLGLSAQEVAERQQNKEPYALRLNSQAAFATLSEKLSWFDAEKGEQQVSASQIGDVILVRKDIGTSYHLAVTIDDAEQEISLVTRSDDLFASTPVHRLIQALLSLPAPQYHHHKILTDQSGERLAKRNQSITLQHLRQSGQSPQDVIEQLNLP